MKNGRLVVIGGDAAGMSAASKAKRENPGLDIVVFEKQRFVSFGLCGLPYYVSGTVKKLEDLLTISPEEFREKRNIDVRLNDEVIKINPDKKSVTAVNEKGKEHKKKYDKLLIATGAQARIPPLGGVDLRNIFTLHWLEDGKKIRTFVKEKNPKKVAVAAGYIGLEMAEAFKEMGLEVVILAKYNHVLPMIDQEIAEPLEKELRNHAVEIRKNSEILGFEGNERGEVQKIITKNGEVEVDFVLLGTGVEPATDLAKEAGIELGDSGGIQVNERMETSIKDIYAAGDCVETTHIVSGKRVNMPLGDIANRQGRVAGINIANGNASFPGILGTAISKVFSLGVARTGVSEKEAGEAGFEFITSTITASSRAFYYPGGCPITIKLIVEKQTGRLLGAQIIGKEGVSQRINVFASLIYNKTTVQEIQNLDLAYAPPFSPAWDPIQTAAKVASGRIE
ncbi:MAG: FAD-dependent oxidoreductase [Euryarchaeota archaeon]|nr:FAD-dependent oxidoreductase [Euryarchaeota archaeon]